MQKNLTLIPVVALALIDRHGSVLLQQRKLGAAHGGMWEFPGGKVKPEETLEMALVREIGEELGIAVVPADLMPLAFASDRSQPPFPRNPHVVLLYTCRIWTGYPQCLVGEAIAWFDRETLSALVSRSDRLVPLDIPLAEALQRFI